MNAKDIKTALNTAELFISKNSLSDPQQWCNLKPVNINRKTAKFFYWDKTKVLVEVPLINSITQSRSGYLLVSNSKDLPPVIEYSTEGDGLYKEVGKLVYPALAASSSAHRIEKIFFYSSTELYVKTVGSKKTGALLHIPSLSTIRNIMAAEIKRKPAQYFDPKIVKAQWDSLTPGNPGDQPQVILSNALPVRYQQNCNKYSLTSSCQINFETTETYCSPNRIAGCVPVAWAMLLSAWKRTGYWDSSKIWRNSTCWNIEWPSWGGWMNPSQCSDVEKTIWRLHTLMQTTADGSTYDSKTMQGAAIFSEFGMTWKYSSVTNKPFNFARKIISAGQPFLFTANGHWSLSEETISSTPVPGGTGHAVVSYGYKKANRSLLVALGWGSSFANKWINYDQYRITRCAYLTSLKATSTGKESEIFELN